MRIQPSAADSEALRQRRLGITALREEAAASHTELEGFLLYASAASLRARAAGLQRSARLSAYASSFYLELETTVLQELAVVEKAIQRLEKGFTIDDPIGLASVVQRTPPEILTEIFRWTLANELRGYSCEVNGRRVLTAPWRLTHVCRAWRNAAHGDGWLWSHVIIDACGLVGDLRVAYPLEALESQLRLSSVAPLKIEFRVDDSTTEMDHCSPLFSLLADQSHRWTHLTVAWGSSCSFLNSILARVTGHIDRLCYLFLDVQTHKSTGRWFSDLSDTFVVAPRLKDIRITNPVLTSHSPPIPFAWSNLTCLHLDGAIPGPPLLLRILEMAQNLIECELIENDVVDSPVDTSGQAVTLPHLLRLACEGHCSILPCLSAPELQDLHLLNSYIPRNLYIPEFLERSRCNLKRFRFASYDERAANIVDCPSTLVHLDLDWDNSSAYMVSVPDFPKIVVAALHYSKGLCPRLTSMCIASPQDRVKSELMDFEAALCEMVESRWNLPTDKRSLRGIRISTIIYSSDVRGRFEALKISGLKINDPAEPMPSISNERSRRTRNYFNWRWD
ncbi:hypothetical protein R3P38DRAFT_2986484 [Favolaschia claudopus]|uniref:F-box domain-containing protein n=1 Tax=Favolaschia claudopus TaxID=2862362 RepID=A0AAW0AX91_9AGAR